MAELLIVVAIIAVLGGVSFVAVNNHQRNLALLERDNIAKEIYVAAQNHLTMAESQGYLGAADFGTPEEGSGGVYYFAYNTDTYADGAEDEKSVLDLMLPFGSIDETVRKGGRYVVRYQASPAVVRDVFYWTVGKPYGVEGEAGFDYETLLGLIGNNGRKNQGGVVIGWYGGDGNALKTGAALEAPSIEVENAERLIVRVTDPNQSVEGASLQLIVTNESGDAQRAIPLSNPSIHERVSYDTRDDVYVVTLDDITAPGLGFADLNSPVFTDPAVISTLGAFNPGENIIVKAVSYNKEALTNIAYSSEITANSLFAELQEATADEAEITSVRGEDEDESGGMVALIGNLRHLLNLNDAVSGLDVDDSGALTLFSRAEQIVDLGKPLSAVSNADEDEEEEPEEEDDFAAAAEVPDLSWTGFVSAIKGAKGSDDAIKVYAHAETVEAKSGDDLFLPLSPRYALTYDGKGHTISDIIVDYDGPAGLFGAPEQPLKASNLALIDFSVTGAGNAGALAGTLLRGSAVENVLACNTPAYDATQALKPTAVSTGGSAGGLIGAMSGSEVRKSAAALIVSAGTPASGEGDSAMAASGGDAGGLIGKADAASKVTASYSGGHTEPGRAAYSATNCNVTAFAGSAGGLIGDAGDTAIQDSYSTCSASGATAGGFAGVASGTIANCYATGLVSGEAEGAFAAELTGTLSDCKYFAIINERLDGESGAIEELPAAANADADEPIAGIQPLDESAAAYNAFAGSPSAWKDAVAYDARLIDYYGGKYSLQVVPQLMSGAASDEDFVAVHYGDWPAPEIFVFNVQ